MYKVYGIKFASTGDRLEWQNYTSPENPMKKSSDIDFFMFLIVNDDRVILVDTGFDQETAIRRNRKLLVEPSKALKQLGYKPEQITDVVITHLHWDHAGALNDFKNSRFHIQKDELIYSTSEAMKYKSLQRYFDLTNVNDFIKILYQGEVIFHSGHEEIAPGVEVYQLGGHTEGLQCVKVLTEKGWVVLASDAAHFWRNYIEVNPFPGFANAVDSLNAYKVLKEMCNDDINFLIPGHDPLLMKCFPLAKGTDNIVRLDLDPIVNIKKEIYKG